MSDKVFDPNSVGINNGNYFGMPFTPPESDLVLISVPWDVTTSYSDGAAQAPDAIIEASLQVDLYDIHNVGGWKRGIATAEIDYSIAERSARFREDAEKVIARLEDGGSVEDEAVVRKLKRINEACDLLNNYVYDESLRYLNDGKKVAVVGGDHSVPLGLMKAVASKYDKIGILHIDAHADLRNAYEGFKYSHASIMYNALDQIPNIAALVQVGVRDFCDTEAELIESDSRITTFNDYLLAESRFVGKTWDSICSEIISKLPEKIYVSFDIDGLLPFNSPNTGTPVPGGLSFHEAVYLLNKAVVSGREIVGFDLTEVAPAKEGQWDANVGARILYKLCNLTLKSK